MKRIYLTAGIAIVIGVLLMATGQALYSANSTSYWDNFPYFSNEVAAAGKRQDQYMAISNVGTMMMGLGLAIIAFGLATEGRPVQFREIPSSIPLQQYPSPPESQK